MAGLVDGKATLITGAASGIGAAAARIFAREGARLVLSDVQTELGAQVAKELEAQGVEAHFIAADVAKEEDVRRLVAKSVELLGALGIQDKVIGLLDFDFGRAVYSARSRADGGPNAGRHAGVLILDEDVVRIELFTPR